MSDNWRDVELLGDDHYDAAVVMGDDAAPSSAAFMPAPVDGTKAILRQAQAQRVAPPALYVEPAHPADDVYADPLVQYEAFTKSMCDYVEKIEVGEIEVPEGVNLSGALAVLHRAGPKALAKGVDDLFPDTRAAFERAREVF